MQEALGSVGDDLERLVKNNALEGKEVDAVAAERLGHNSVALYLPGLVDAVEEERRGAWEQHGVCQHWAAHEVVEGDPTGLEQEVEEERE